MVNEQKIWFLIYVRGILCYSQGLRKLDMTRRKKKRRLEALSGRSWNWFLSGNRAMEEQQTIEDR